MNADVTIRGIETLLWLVVLALPVALRSDRAAARPQPLLRETEILGLGAVLAVAVVFRVVNLCTEPLFMLNDETMFVYEQSWRPEYRDLYGFSLIQHWPWGWWPDLFGFGSGSLPNLQHFLHWLPMLVHPGFYGLRFGSAIVGVLSVAMIYVWARRWWDNRVALLASLFLAINLENVYWSRMAMPNIDAALHATAMLWALAWALDTQSPRAWAVLGVIAGLTMYLYMGCKLSCVALAAVLAGMWLSRRVSISARCVGVATVFCLAVAAPSFPPIYTHFHSWYVDHAGRLDVARLLAAVWHGDWAGAWRFLVAEWADSVQYFRDQPWLTRLWWGGILLALWRGRDRRYLAILIWAAVTFGIASVSIGWRNARIVNVQPALAVFAALTIDQLLRWRASRALALGLVALVLYEAWTGQFTLRAHRWRNATAELCTTLWSLPAPATVYVIGTGPNDDWLWRRCVMPPGSIQLIPVEGAEQIVLNDSHTAAIVYADRPDAAERLTADAVLTPHYDGDRFSFYSGIGKKWAVPEAWGR